jgi:hypothetical protein
LVVRLRDRVDDRAAELGDVRQLEVEARLRGEEGGEAVEVGGRDLRGRDPRIEQRDRQRDALADALGVQLVVGGVELRMPAGENERDVGAQGQLEAATAPRPM